MTDDHLTPVSSTTGDGLSDLTLRIFQLLPEGVSLAVLQETLLEERKASRLEFVITEVSSILARVALMDGKAMEEVKIWIVVLYLLVCQHYSVDEETWLKFNGDITQIQGHVSQHGVNKIKRPREPKGFLEWFRSMLLGTKFFDDAIEFRRLGIAGLEGVTPRVYSLLYDLAGIATSKRSNEEVVAVIRAAEAELDPLISRDDANGLASALAPHLLELFKRNDNRA